MKWTVFLCPVKTRNNLVFIWLKPTFYTNCVCVFIIITCLLIITSCTHSGAFSRRQTTWWP